MKELSIEEKAKRYDDVIERAKKVLLDCTPEEQKVVEYITPELKESEDERIRKDIINLVKKSNEYGGYALHKWEADKMLAWLEKRKNNMSISEATKQVLEDNLNKALEKETPESCNEFLEKQGEQKTAEEYNITGIGSKNAQGKLGEMIKNLKPVNEVLEQKTADNKDYSAPLDIEIPFGAKDSELIQETIRIPDGCHAFIKGNEIVIKKEENPAWSEEDERHFSWLIEHLGQSAGLYDNLIDWLKSLKDRIQPKVELTQFDKNILEAAIAFVEQNNHFNCWRGVDKHTVLSALHSLKPQNTWKPSNEQMGALANACDGKILNLDYLNSLYQDLKKLKKENSYESKRST